MGCVGCVGWGNTETCVGHTDTVGYNFSNTSARAAFVDAVAAENRDYGYDGISLELGERTDGDRGSERDRRCQYPLS